MMRTIVKASSLARSRMSSQAVSPRVKNLIIGMSRAYDPIPITGRANSTKIQNGGSLQETLASDQRNLLKDRIQGERKIFGGQISVLA